MELTLARFVRALRSADVPVSPAETLDALEVVRQVGMADRRILRDALALTLAKTREEKLRFSETFERFFGESAFQIAPKATLLGGIDRHTVAAAIESHAPRSLRELVDQVLGGDRALLAWRLQTLAESLDVRRVRTLRDKRVFADELLTALEAPAFDVLLRAPELAGESGLSAVLRYVRQYLREEVQRFVDRQYALAVDATGKRALLEATLAANLDQLPPGYYADAARVVRKLAAGLLQRHRRQQQRVHRGQLDIRRALRENVAYDGTLFRLRWRQRRTRRASVFVICDLSGSVSRIARFLLTFVHELAAALPEVRVFGFSNRLGEVSDLFQRHGPERAVEEAILTWGRGSTDYGRALLDLRELIQGDVDRRSTLIILGDARSNYYEPHVSVLRELSQRARQVFWLNPESRERWGEGDSLMRRYAPYCLRIDSCARLSDIERFADRLLGAVR
jgi:hypothetical protein